MAAVIAGVLTLACGGDPRSGEAPAVDKPPAPESSLVWEPDDGGFVLSGQEGKAYLVVEELEQGSAIAAAGLSWKTDTELKAPGTVVLYELVPRLRCGLGQECNECRPDHPDDCPPVGPPPPPRIADELGRTTFAVWVVHGGG